MNLIKKSTSSFAVAICAVVASQARGGLIAEWQFNSYGSGGSISDYNPEYGSQASPATTAILTATQNASKQSFTSITGTTVNQDAPSSPNNFALQMATTGGSPPNGVLTLEVSGTGLQDFVLTYAAESKASYTQTWYYSINGTAYTEFATTASTTSFTTLTENFSSIGALNNATTVYLQDIIAFTGNSDTIGFDNIAINASPIPEPIDSALAVFGLVFVGGSAGRFYLGRKRVSLAA